MSKAPMIPYASTSTGVTAPAYLGDVYSKAHIELVSDSTQTVVFTVEGRVGSGAWQNVAVATTSTGGVTTLTSAAEFFSVLRVNISANNTTSTGAALRFQFGGLN